ncbi:MAG: von Willebrand factor, partial [Paenibacillus sp.]|nr:von Willebrand factor [Paenibacillus sp.]
MNRRLVNRLALAAIVSIAGIWLSFWLYAGLTTIPRGVRYGEWMIGGMKQQAFRQQLETKLALLYNEPVQLRLDGGNTAEATFTLGQLGLTLDISQLEQLTELWFEGSRLSRAKSRWRLNDIALPLDFRLTEQQLTQALTAIWPDRLQPPVKNAERVVTADDMIR